MSGKPSVWLRVVVPVALILVWLVLAGIGGPTFGKLSGVSSNDQAAFLPASAESTAVQDWQKRFTDSQAVPAIVVVQSGSTCDGVGEAMRPPGDTVQVRDHATYRNMGGDGDVTP